MGYTISQGVVLYGVTNKKETSVRRTINK
jgi:hypothetical protein